MHVPCSLVDVVVVDPDQIERRRRPTIRPWGEVRVDLGALEAAPFGIEKVIARRAAMELAVGDVAALGFGVSALVPRILVEEGLHGQVTWTIEQGPVGGVPVTGFAFGCALNADAIIPSPQQFTFFQGAGFDCGFVSFLQIDRAGNVNVSRLAKRPYRPPGWAVSSTSRRAAAGWSAAPSRPRGWTSIEDGRVAIRQEGKIKLVPEVEQVTFSGRRGRAQRQEVIVVTERCVRGRPRRG